MFEVTFLGTAAGVPSVERGLPALLVQARHLRFLIDCGEGTQRQLLKSGLGFRRLERVLFTHAHLDHILGLGGLLGTLALLDAADKITLPDGRRVLPDEALGAVRPGTTLAVVGDAGDAEALVPHVRGADALIVEATFLERDADKAAARGHLTAAQAARLAGDAGVGALYLTHISPRYTQDEMEKEATAIFAATVVARDFDRVVVRASGASPGRRPA